MALKELAAWRTRRERDERFGVLVIFNFLDVWKKSTTKQLLRWVAALEVGIRPDLEYYPRSVGALSGDRV